MFDIYELITDLAFSLGINKAVRACSHKVLGVRKFSFALASSVIIGSCFSAGNGKAYWSIILGWVGLSYPAFQIRCLGLGCCCNIYCLASLFIIINYYLLSLHFQNVYNA